jgi:hypothetical protein
MRGQPFSKRSLSVVRSKMISKLVTAAVVSYNYKEQHFIPKQFCLILKISNFKFVIVFKIQEKGKKNIFIKLLLKNSLYFSSDQKGPLFE